MIICGIDEAGRGPLAGPVVVAAVIMDKSCIISGIRDSKKLTHKKRVQLFDEIINKSSFHRIEIIDNIIIDEINILKSVMLGIEKCIYDLDRKETELLIDGNYFKLKNDAQKNFKYRTIIKGDSKIYEISCASILAKVTRDRIMIEYDNIYPEYNFKSNKGYATQMHLKNLLKFGPCAIHRNTFIKKIIEQGMLFA
ncbi:MAG: ribonuclease HII [Ignavibacteria bacterium]|jgi:ribonuclease HII|nr:ribonuclease HII [Ignavibacteria bacterium]